MIFLKYEFSLSCFCGRDYWFTSCKAHSIEDINWWIRRMNCVGWKIHYVTYYLTPSNFEGWMDEKKNYSTIFLFWFVLRISVFHEAWLYTDLRLKHKKILQNVDRPDLWRAIISVAGGVVFSVLSLAPVQRKCPAETRSLFLLLVNRGLSLSGLGHLCVPRSVFIRSSHLKTSEYWSVCFWTNTQNFN